MSDAERLAAWDRQMGLPTRLNHADLEQHQNSAAMARARKYVQDDLQDGLCLVLSGPTGVGKSFAAAAIFRALGGKRKRFWYFPALCGALLDPNRRAETLAEATGTPFAVFDDFGVEYVKEGGLVDAFLDEIIWTREAEFRPTIITTNLSADGLKQRLPARLIDRLRGEWGIVYECPGESLR